jgi:hypothetical protein
MGCLRLPGGGALRVTRPAPPTSAPAAAQLLLLPLVPESPRYLLVKGRTDDAERALSRVLRLCRKSLPEGRLQALKEKRAGPGEGVSGAADRGALFSAPRAQNSHAL